MKQLMRWNFLAALERNPKTPIRCALWTPLRETVVPAGLPLFSACIILEDVTAVPRGCDQGLLCGPKSGSQGRAGDQRGVPELTFSPTVIPFTPPLWGGPSFFPSSEGPTRIATVIMSIFQVAFPRPKVSDAHCAITP